MTGAPSTTSSRTAREMRLPAMLTTVPHGTKSTQRGHLLRPLLLAAQMAMCSGQCRSRTLRSTLTLEISCVSLQGRNQEKNSSTPSASGAYPPATRRPRTLMWTGWISRCPRSSDSVSKATRATTTVRQFTAAVNASTRAEGHAVGARTKESVFTLPTLEANARRGI